MADKTELRKESESALFDHDFRVVEVNDVSKTYCRDLRKSLWYGVQDIFRGLTFRAPFSGALRADEFEAVKNATFDVKRGECVALLGPNGAGKSSMLKMINGILRPSRGSIHIRGRISALIELGTGFNPILTGRENVFINASVLGFSKEETEERFEDILKFSEIGEFIDAPVRSYSSGMKMRLGFAVASHLAPDLMLIDEVLAVGDLAFRMKCYDHLQKKVASGVSVILVSHIVAMMPRFCTRAIVFDKGSIVFDGDIMEGIAEYQKILGLEKAKLKGMDEESFPGDDEPENAEQSGTPTLEVQIDSIRTLNEQGDAADTFSSSEPIIAEVVLKATESFSECKLVLNLDSASFGMVASMGSNRQKFRFDIEPGETRIQIRLGPLPVIDGGYSFNATLYGKGKANLLDQKNALASFRILNQDGGRPALKGILLVDSQWSKVQPDEE